MEIAGGVVSTSPYKVNMMSKVDDVEMFRSDLTLDEDKKSIEVNMFEGSGELTYIFIYIKNPRVSSVSCK